VFRIHKFWQQSELVNIVQGKLLLETIRKKEQEVMSYIQFNFRPEVTQEHHRKLEKMLSDVGVDDKVDIVVENADAHQTDQLMNVLHQHGFDYQPQGGHGTSYHILAWRRPH